MIVPFDEIYRQVFEEHSIRIKANSKIMHAVGEKIVIQERQEDEQGVDWQGNKITVSNSNPLVENLLAGSPVNYGDDEDFEYSISKLFDYTVTPDEALEIFDLTETVIFQDDDSAVKAYDKISALYHRVLDMKQDSFHFNGTDEMQEEMDKMIDFINNLKPIVTNIREGNRTTLQDLFNIGIRAIGFTQEDVDRRNVVMTKRREPKLNKSTGIAGLSKLLGV